MNNFEVPIVLFFFKRDKIVRIIEKISEIRPRKIYLISDGARNKEEESAVNNCRQLVEKAITWDCEIIKNYAKENRGVYDRIGLGAKWVLTQEEQAIFLEDDNLPDITFFRFCKEMLDKYKDDTRILWICGTNYLEKFQPADGASYVFTKHMFPCGWASWREKFNRFYDGDLSLCENDYLIKRIEKEYCNKKVYKQYKFSFMSEYKKIINNKRPASWDYQMDFSIKANGLLGICPKHNLIENIGVDTCSVHGGTSFNNVMTKRFCSMKTVPLEFPLIHPKIVLTDLEFEKKIGKIILYPLKIRLRSQLSNLLKSLLRIKHDKNLIQELNKKLFNKK